VKDDAPFVIARKLLRRRHVRKEQVRKAREALNTVGDNRIRRKRKAEKSDGEPTRKRVTAAGPLPHSSPMLTKSDSFLDVFQTKGQGDVDSGTEASTMIFHSTSLITFSPLRSRTYRY
jgi:hypothetical protein